MSSTDFREQIKKKTQVLIQHIIDHHPDPDSNEECGVIDEFEDAIVKLHEAEVEQHRQLIRDIAKAMELSGNAPFALDILNEMNGLRAAITPKGGDKK